MTLLKSLLHNRNAIFLLALATGLALPAVTTVTKHLVLPALALAMTVSTMEIGNDLFRKPRALLFPAFLGIIMSYVILGNIIIGLAAFMIRDDTIWTGFILLAAVPPAVAVIPFSGFLNGNGTLSFIGTVGAYLGGLVIMPLIAIGLHSSAALDPLQLLMVTLELIVLPLCVSRILIREGWRERIAPYRGKVIDWSFFVVLYTLIGLNRNTILGQPLTLLPIAAVSIITMFILGFLIDWIGSRFHLQRETRMSLVLLGTLKNQGLAGGIALTMFSQEAALPAAVSTMVMIAYIICLDFRKRWNG
ncbi:MAG: bile acid:sodium symporter family protein [Syntrophales bacterium]